LKIVLENDSLTKLIDMKSPEARVHNDIRMTRIGIPVEKPPRREEPFAPPRPTREPAPPVVAPSPTRQPPVRTPLPVSETR